MVHVRHMIYSNEQMTLLRRWVACIQAAAMSAFSTPVMCADVSLEPVERPHHDVFVF